MLGARIPDDLCPRCGVPWDGPPGRGRCARCGADPAAPDISPRGGLTRFGRVLLSLMLGTHLGIAIALTDPALHLGDPRVVLFPLLGAGACWGLTSALTRRLDPGVLPGFEALLCGLAAGALVVLILTLAGVTAPESLLPTGAVIAIAATWWARKKLAPTWR